VRESAETIVDEYGSLVSTSKTVVWQYGLHTTIEDDGLPKPLNEGARIFLFRALRELLINVAKHAEADKARVCLSRDGDTLALLVEDAGPGFDPGMATRGFGLLSMREHLRTLGGEMRVESTRGEGTKVFLKAPLTIEGVPAGG
jgi:signal transduction histidine kinase